MKKQIILKRIFHRDKPRILIAFDYDEALVELVRHIDGITFSSTYKGWYTVDNEDKLKEILRVLKDTQSVDISLMTHPREAERNNGIQEEEVETTIQVESNSPNSSLQVERDDSANELLPTRSKIQKVVPGSGFGKVEFRIVENEGRLAIRFKGHYDQEWVEEIISYGNVSYSKESKEFFLPWSVSTADSLADYFSSQGVETIMVKNTTDSKVVEERNVLSENIKSRNLGEKAQEGLGELKRYLEEVRYSQRTRNSYLSLIEFFFKYFNEKDPASIVNEEVSDFIYDYIIGNGYSRSYQNQMISAIKTYYRFSGHSAFDLSAIERPRRTRALPKVFSKEEIKRILNATRNTKHKLLLWMIYSCGLRRSEITNILLTDLDRDRDILHIREGKGRVDRIVPVSSKVWEKLDDYIDGYRPVKYLFEGQTGGKYSSESVYRVFKQALRTAGIKKDVGVHSLRHSYATHLHESGLDIRYIQELLGHKSSKTTEIYTHVSRRNLMQVRSPIEDIDLK
jgi:integrase/recombinase XerD